MESWNRNPIVAAEMGAWVGGLAEWQVISHLTFRWEASIWAAQRAYEKFMRKELWGVSYFYALEANPARDGFHAHSLWVGCGGTNRRETWRKWFDRYGRARIEPVRDQGDVTSYCAKYVTKEGAWWDLKIQRHLRKHETFALTNA
jgi:hypothetical protein